MRNFKRFHYKNAQYNISSVSYRAAVASIKKDRTLLEEYIKRHPEFKTSLVPLPLVGYAPLIAKAMAGAAFKTGVGPMAAVAGAIAENAARTALSAGCDEAIVENGGDIYAISHNDVVIGLYPGEGKLSASLAFSISPEEMPIAVCSSSSIMGHSLSFGACDCATVVSGDGALADAAATAACNAVKKTADIEPVCTNIAAIPGIIGVLIIKDNNVGIAGNLPRLIKNMDPKFRHKINW
ncbi:MAG: UPF0280 family protein [Spirochaetales bacterium]|nr:UPF0280 family protein [Spirochaetales bacterium]